MWNDYRPEELYPMLRAENADVVIHPDDRKYGALLVGGQGTGKTSVLLTFYKNDVECDDTAPIVIDPKSELARLCLRRTPSDCGKRVWFLDLGHPAFGMNPLRLIGDRPLAIEAAQIAENVVAALLDINENQIFQSSRRYLYHAVIGAIAIAFNEKRRAKLEDVYTLLRPAREDFRAIVAEACAIEPDLDQTAEFFRSELPDDLRMSPGRVAERMDAPRNKVSGLMGVPPLRRFFNHPTDIPLREIIEARHILIVDANMAAIGTDNSRACMLFILRMLNAQLQRQVHVPERDRPRVPLLVDEAHYVLGAESVVDQIATHRAGGLEPAFGVQYLAQLGSGSEHQEKILKGVLNLLQSRFLFRMGDAQDAEETSRIAMAVYATMIRDDPDSRARLRVTPEQLLNFPNYFCLASWIADGNRAPAFTGGTFALPVIDDVWADYHLAAQAERVGPYPEHLESTLDTYPSEALEVETGEPAQNGASGKSRREYLQVPYAEKDAANRLGAEWDPGVKRWYVPAGRDPEPFARWRVPAAETDSQPPANPSEPDANGHHRADEAVSTDPPPQKAARRTQPPNPAARRQPPKREVRVDYEPPPPPPKLDDGPARRVLGRRVPGAAPGAHDAPAPDSLRELAFLDRINEISPAEQHQGAASLPRLYDEDYAILALLDRAGLVPRTLIGRATLPGRTSNTVIDRLTKLHRHGLIAQHQTGLREHASADGRPPLLYSLTRRGMEVAQTRQPPAISRKREWRPVEQGRALRLAHDLHALAWGIELHRLVGEVATDHWRTPRYATGRYQVPQIGSGRNRHPITLNEIPLPDKQAIVDLGLKEFAEIKPDLSLELRIPSMQLNFDLLVELDLTSRPSYNRDKLLAYDAFLCGWSLAHPRYQTQGTRPVVVFVCSHAQAVLALAREADEAMTGRIGVMGTGPEHWYHAGRDHVFFAAEADIYYDDLAAVALPARPPGLRERLTGTRELELERVALLPSKLGS